MPPFDWDAYMACILSRNIYLFQANNFNLILFLLNATFSRENPGCLDMLG